MQIDDDLKTQEKTLRTQILDWCKQFHPVIRSCASPDPTTRDKAINKIRADFGDAQRDFLNQNIRKIIELRSDIARNNGTSIMDGFLQRNNLHIDDVENGIGQIGQHAPELLQQYSGFKKRLLHKPVLHIGELEAPQFQYGAQPFSWKDTKSVVRDVYRDLGFEDQVSEMLEKRSKVKLLGKDVAGYEQMYKGKAHIQASLDGSLFDPRSIVHEAAHGIHTESCVGKKHYTPALAETITLFAEAMFVRKMLAKAQTAEQRIAILSNQLDMDVGYIMQAAQVDFEQKAYQSYSGKESDVVPLSLWLESLKKFAGENIATDRNDVLPEAKMAMWNHFVSEPGYSFGYLIGWAAAPQLVEQYESNPEAFTKKFTELLGKGGEITADDFLKAFGVDMRSPDFWENRFAVMQKQIEELEKLYKTQTAGINASDSANALLLLSRKAQGKSSPSVTLEGNSVLLDNTDRNMIQHGAEKTGIAYVDGSGGFKKVYGLPDGRAIAVLNLDSLRFSGGLDDAAKWAQKWWRAIHEEKAVSDAVRAANLESQQIDIKSLMVDGHKLPVMVMPRFEYLANNGLQIRDVKNPTSSCGHSMIFGTPQNFESADRLQLVMQGLLDDAAVVMQNGFSFGGDSCNIAIKDTENTPIHDRNVPALFDELNQKLRFFFFDFSSKHGPRNDNGLPLLDIDGKPDRSKIRDYADHYVTRAYDSLLSAIRPDEIERILELKKSYPSQHTYDNQFDIWKVADRNFESIKNQMVDELTEKVIGHIEKMPLAERLQKLRRPENSPPLELSGNGQVEHIQPTSHQQQKGVI